MPVLASPQGLVVSRRCRWTAHPIKSVLADSKQAIAILEQGRVLLWFKMRRLRTSMDQIRSANSCLADEFATVNRDLKKLTFTFLLNDSVCSRDDYIESMDPFGQLVVQQ